MSHDYFFLELLHAAAESSDMVFISWVCLSRETIHGACRKECLDRNACGELSKVPSINWDPLKNRLCAKRVPLA